MKCNALLQTAGSRPSTTAGVLANSLSISSSKGCGGVAASFDITFQISFMMSACQAQRKSIGASHPQTEAQPLMIRNTLWRKWGDPPNAALVFPGICFWDWKNFFKASASSSTSFLALKYLLVMSESFSTYSFWVLSMYLIKQVKLMQWQQTNQQPCPFESTSSGELTSRIGTCWPTGVAAEKLFHLSFAVVCLVGLDISLRGGKNCALAWFK